MEPRKPSLTPVRSNFLIASDSDAHPIMHCEDRKEQRGSGNFLVTLNHIRDIQSYKKVYILYIVCLCVCVCVYDHLGSVVW